MCQSSYFVVHHFRVYTVKTECHKLTLSPITFSDSTSCLTCPEKFTSPPSSMNLSDCLCNSGTESGVGTSGGHCLDCLPGKYKATQGNTLCISCPENATSLVVSKRLNDCYCPVGYFGPPGSPCEEEVSSIIGCFPVLFSYLSLSISESPFFCYTCTCACAFSLFI